MCWLSGKEAARSAWSEECKGRKPCREDYAGRVVGRDCKGTQESARACKAGGCTKSKEWGVQGHRGMHGLRDGRGVGYRGHGDAGMQGNAFMEDGAGKVDAREN